MNDKLNSSVCSMFMKGLAEPERLRIVEFLLEGSKSVGEIAEALGVPMANTSHHLLVLKQCGLVQRRRDGKYIFYSLSPGLLAANDGSAATLNFGCCRVELGAPAAEPPARAAKRRRTG